MRFEICISLKRVQNLNDFFDVTLAFRYGASKTSKKTKLSFWYRSPGTPRLHTSQTSVFQWLFMEDNLFHLLLILDNKKQKKRAPKRRMCLVPRSPKGQSGVGKRNNCHSPPVRLKLFKKINFYWFPYKCFKMARTSLVWLWSVEMMRQEELKMGVYDSDPPRNHLGTEVGEKWILLQEWTIPFLAAMGGWPACWQSWRMTQMEEE